MDPAIPLPPLLSVPAGRLHDLEAGGRLEWVEPDGLGGYAMGTAAGVNTRRYHGLLVVARRPPADRFVLLSRVEDVVVLDDGTRHALGVSHYPDAVYPEGHRMLEGFALDPWPVWRYRLGDAVLVREVFHARRPRATVLTYRLVGASGVLELRPVVAARTHHALARANDRVRRSAEASERIVAYAPYEGTPALVLSFGDGAWQHEPIWLYRAVYPRETERGLDDREDLFSPGLLRLPLRADPPTVVACGLRPARVSRLSIWVADELTRRGRAAAAGQRMAGAVTGLREPGARLGMAADAFLVERGTGRSIMAGYPWFVDWGRDALVALPGLLLARERLDDARAVLETFASHLHRGLVPVRFPDDGAPPSEEDYASADTSLWFVRAVVMANCAGMDTAPLTPAVEEVLSAYAAGTLFGIGADEDGLVRHGEGDRALTWMDARVDGRAVTPRAGRAIEVNALWYDALLGAAALPEARRSDEWRERAARCRGAFWKFRTPAGWLADCLDPDGRADARLRPNQLLALGLAHSPVAEADAATALHAVETALLVPGGVRTLAPDEADYAGRFSGPLRDLDRAYHNGTAWPWLLAPWARAALRVRGAAARTDIRRQLEALADTLRSYGLGQVPEVLDGNAPHAPGGCPAQAWSVAAGLELLALLDGAGPWRMPEAGR
jgi:predicted glycogen debranching enzyme